MDSAFRILRPHGKGGLVILCDHASNRVPAELESLGLPPSDLQRHIAWDIGAAGVTEELSNMFDAPAILCGTSRLVIDCNRQLRAPDLIPAISDGTTVPGNQNLTAEERLSRIDRWFEPYHAAVESVIATCPNATVLSIHSMTENLAGQLRPWPIALSSHKDRTLVEPVLNALRQFNVGDNQPYDLDPAIDYSIPYHAMRRNLPYLQVEFRQDEIADPGGQRIWAARFAEALKS